MAGENDIITSAWNRFWELGKLTTKVGTSLATNAALNFFYTQDSQEKKKLENLLCNAERITQSLSRLKGGAMKIGQMLSLQDGLLPPEVMAVLQSLQKDSLPVPFHRIQETLESEMPDYRDKFSRIEEKPFASASIGQVHKAVTREGEDVIIKIQYPGIDRAILGDLKNLRVLFKALASWFTNTDINPIWTEIKIKLLEEIDYLQESRNQQYFNDHFSGHPRIRIPRPFPELTTRRVITSEFVAGISLEEAARLSQEERNLWAGTLFELGLGQLVKGERLHTDPNAANFAFLREGVIIVYDFGSVKITNPVIRDGYREIMKASMQQEMEKIPEILFTMGIRMSQTSPIPWSFIQPYAEIFLPIFTEKPYCFGGKNNLIKKVMDQARGNAFQARDLSFPADMVFIDRTIGGHMGNLARLAPCGDWEKILTPLLE